MTASAADTRPITRASKGGGTDPARLRERGDKLRGQAPDLSDAQLRHLLQREGFPIDAIGRYLRGEDKPAPSAPSPSPAPATPSGRGAGGLWEGPGTASGVLLALVAYPAGLAYLRGGNDGLKAWFRAKFLNQTATDPGIATEAWLTPGTSTGTSTTAARSGLLKLPPVPKALRKKFPKPTAKSRSLAGEGAVAFARSQIGKPYRWGGTGPNSWDCSGLTQAAWQSVGVRIPRTTTLQLAMLAHVKRSEMIPGDLIFPEPTHVQMYAGGGHIIEAPHTGAKVRQMPLGHVMAVRRPRLRGANT